MNLIKIFREFLKNFPVKYFLFTTNLKEFKLLIIKTFVKSVFTKLLSLIYKDKRKIVNHINLLVFLFDIFIFNIRLFFQTLIGIIHPGGIWCPHFSEEFYFESEHNPNGVPFDYECHLNCSPVDLRNGDRYFSLHWLQNIPYAGIINQQASLLKYNIYKLISNPDTYRAFQGNESINPSVFENLPIHTSYTLYNNLNPIFFNFFLGQREFWCNDTDGNPVIPGYIMKNGNFMYRYIPDNMLYFSYAGGGGYNPDGWGLLSQCPFEEAKHPLHQGAYGFTFVPVYRVYYPEDFDPITDQTNGGLWFSPERLNRFVFPEVVSNLPELAGHEVISNFNSSSYNNVYVIKCDENDLREVVIISDHDLNGKVSYCVGNSSHFLHGKRLVYDENGFYDINYRRNGLNFENLLGGEIGKINVREHYDIQGAALVTGYNRRFSWGNVVTKWLTQLVEYFAYNENVNGSNPLPLIKTLFK